MKVVLMDEFHLTLFAPRKLLRAAFDAIHQTLDDLDLHARMRRSIHRLFRRYPALQKVRIRVSR